MRRILSLLACLVVALGGSIVTGVSADASLSDVDAAYCPYGSITGHGYWTPAETTTTQWHSFEWITDASCPGVTDDAGTYAIDFHFGQAFDSCLEGDGAGAIDGYGPEGETPGTFIFYRAGVHLYINGEFLSGGEWHKLAYWLDVVPPLDGVCNYTEAQLIGHGAIADDPISA